jgi:hypothetical protein
MFCDAGLGDTVILSPSVKLKFTIPVINGVNDWSTPVLKEELSENLKKDMEADSPILKSKENPDAELELPPTLIICGLID